MSEERREIEIIPPGEDPIGGPASRLWVSHGQGQVRIAVLGAGAYLSGLFGAGPFKRLR